MQLGCWESLTDNVFLLLEIDVMMWLPFFWLHVSGGLVCEGHGLCVEMLLLSSKK